MGILPSCLATGDGTFRTGVYSFGVDYSFSFAAPDLTGNGTADVVFSVANGISVCLGNGDGTFQPAVSYTVNDSNFGFVVVGDFNGDHILDVATPGLLGVWLFTGRGDGTFNPGVLAAALPSSNNQIAAADFNGDGNLDLVVSSYSAGFVVLLGNGNGTFGSPQIFSQPKSPLGLAAGGLTKGGPAGIAIGSKSSGYVSLYTGNGAGGFSGPKYVSLPDVEGDGLAIGDVNGDGNPDLISAGGYVAFGVGGGSFSKAANYPIVAEGLTVVLADLANNGLTDMVMVSYFGTSVLLNQGQGQFEDGMLEAAQHFLTAGLRAHDLQRDLFAEGVVGAHGQIDGPHTALADFAEDFIWTYAAAFQALRILGRDGRPGQQIGIVPMRGEQPLDFGLQIGIPRAGLRQERAASVRRTLHHGLEKVANLSEAFRCHALHVPNSGIST
jgi:hypothetical protein